MHDSNTKTAQTIKKRIMITAKIGSEIGYMSKGQINKTERQKTDRSKRLTG